MSSLDPQRARSDLVVAMVIQNYLPNIGGAERQLANISPRLRAFGIRPVIVTRSHPDRPRHESLDGVEVFRIPTRGPKLVRSAMFVIGAARVLRRVSPDVVHAFDSLTPSIVAARYKHRTGTPFVTKILCSGEAGDLAALRHKPLGTRRLRALVSNADGFIVISDDIDAELEAAGVPESARVRVPNGVDCDHFSPVTETTGNRTTSPEVVALPGKKAVVVGRITNVKRVVELARSWTTVRDVNPQATLIVVGDGPLAPELANLPGVVWLGPRDDIADILRSVDVYVSASTAEGLSNALLEAMASGLACVVTDVGGARDLLTHGETGLVVDADDLAGIVEGVASCFSDPDLARRLGAQARAVVQKNFGIETTAGLLATSYWSLVEPGGAR